MRTGRGWIWVGVALAAAPAMAAVAGSGGPAGANGQQPGTKAAEERAVDFDEMRAEFFERLSELLAGGWLDARGTIVPESAETSLAAPDPSAVCDDNARGTIVPPGCG